jgi:uncharacterized OsmC-like protein
MTAPEDVNVVQRPSVTVRPAPGRTKIVSMPIDGDVVMGMRDEVAEHYKISADDLSPHATTLDYLIGAAAGCLTGTLSGMLLALDQETHDGKLETHAEAVIVSERHVLRIASIHVTYRLTVDEGVDRNDVERAHARHHRHCPIAASIGSAIDITSELVLS